MGEYPFKSLVKNSTNHIYICIYIYVSEKIQLITKHYLSGQTAFWKCFSQYCESNAHINAKRKKFIRPIQAEPSSRRCEDYFRILNQAILIREKCMLAKLQCQLISTGLTFVPLTTSSSIHWLTNQLSLSIKKKLVNVCVCIFFTSFIVCLASFRSEKNKNWIKT